MITMKKQLLLIVLTMGLFAFTSDNNEHYAIVEKVSDVPFFVFSKPVSEYEIVGKTMSFKEMVKMAVDQGSSTREKAREIVKISKNKVKEGKLSAFDALIVELDNDKVLAVKFKSDISTKAKIENYGELPVYFFNKPDEKYEVVTQLKADYSQRAKKNGMLYDKIKSMVKRTLKKKENGEIENFDAIIINPDDLSETLINFKK